MAKAACEKWLDVRSFGQVLPKSVEGDGVLVGVKVPYRFTQHFCCANKHYRDSNHEEPSDEAVDRRVRTMG